MNAFDKAIARIEAAKTEHGDYPVDLTLVKYDDNHDFQLAFPGDDFKAHCEQIDKLIAWCAHRSIKIVFMPFDPELMKGGAKNRGNRARSTIVPPYKLGLDLHSGALGWSIVELSRESNSRGDRRPVGLGVPDGKMGKD